MTHLSNTGPSSVRRTTDAALGRSLLLLLFAGAGLAVTLHDSTLLPSAPPLRDVRAWSAWVDGRAPLDVVAGVTRVVVPVLLAYLLVVSVAHLAVAIAPGQRGRSIIDRLTPRLLAALLAGSVLGVAPASAASTPATDRSADISPGAGATMEIIDDDERDARTHLPWAASLENRSASLGPPTQSAPPTQPAPATPPTAVNPHPEAPAAVTEAPQPNSGPQVPASSYSVVVGDHLWGIAEQHLRSHGVYDSDVLVRYWQTLIDENRDRLIDPENPDLIHPGQQLELPPLR